VFKKGKTFFVIKTPHVLTKEVTWTIRRYFTIPYRQDSPC